MNATPYRSADGHVRENVPGPATGDRGVRQPALHFTRNSGGRILMGFRHKAEAMVYIFNAQ